MEGKRTAPGAAAGAGPAGVGSSDAGEAAAASFRVGLTAYLAAERGGADRGADELTSFFYHATA